MYKITLKDGTELDNLALNGNNFISKTEIKETDLTNANLATVVITSNVDSETAMVGTFKDMFLIKNEAINGEWWFVLAEKTQAMWNEERLSALEAVMLEMMEV